MGYLLSAARHSSTVQPLLTAHTVQNDRMISVYFRGKPFNITVIQVYVPTSNAEEVEVEQFYDSPAAPAPSLLLLLQALGAASPPLVLLPPWTCPLPV